MADTTPLIEVENIESESKTFEIKDSRQNKDSSQQFAISERLKKDNVSVALARTHRFLGEYASNGPEDLEINIVDGKIGEGTIKGKSIELEMPSGGGDLSQLELALAASTALHEGAHGLLRSRPDSQFATDFERVSGFPNQNGDASTLLDEGIAYAVQGIYAPVVEPIGYLAPLAREGEDRTVWQRKKLGEKLRPVVKRYIEGNRSIDDGFFQAATNIITELQ